MIQIPQPRIVIVGTSGSGKTTVAQRAARILDVPHVELDALHWEPNWQQAEIDVFRARVEDAISGDAWIVDGNYSKVRDLIWERANALVWLDYPFWLVMWRIVTRTLRRTLTREELWSGNRESFRKAFFSRDSIIVWSFTTYHRRRDYPQLFIRPDYQHLTVYRHRSPAQTERWLAELSARPV